MFIVTDLVSLKKVFVKFMYCKFGNFRENFIFANRVKSIFATLKFAIMA